MVKNYFKWYGKDAQTGRWSSNNKISPETEIEKRFENKPDGLYDIHGEVTESGKTNSETVKWCARVEDSKVTSIWEC